MTNTELPEPDTIRALDAVTSRASTTTRRRGLIVGGLAAAAAAAAAVVIAVSVTGDDNAREHLPVDQTPTQTPVPGSVVEASWGYAYVSDPVTFEVMAQNLRDHGLGEWIEPLHEKWGDFDGRIHLDFEDGQLTASIPGTPVSHTNSYLVFRDFLSFEGSDSQFEATATEIDGGGQRLTLTLTKSETAPTGGIPGEVYERALYTTVPFNEIPPPSQADLSPGTYQSGPLLFGRVASSLRAAGMGSWVEPLRELWGDAAGTVYVRLELDGDTANLSVPGTQVTSTGPYTTDGSLIRIEDADPRDDNGWIELVSRPYELYGPTAVFFYKLWDAGPAPWNGLPAEVIAKAFFTDTHFTPTEE